MTKDDFVSNPELLKELRKLHYELREYTKKKYNRINPFTENLFDWKEKGNSCCGKNVAIYDSTTIVGDVEIGDNTRIGPFCSLDGTGKLKIGMYCSISVGTQILTHDTVKYALSGGKHEYAYSPVIIGDCCFIGVHSIILKGIELGNHCLVAANSVVNKSFDDFAIIAGAPAKTIGRVEIANGTVELIYITKKKKKEKKSLSMS